MKLATLRDGTRDGRLVVVSKDLSVAVFVEGGPRTLQAALDDWDEGVANLQRLSEDLNAGKLASAFAFDPAQALAPLPRAYQWLDASAFLSHGVLMQRALGLEINPQSDAAPLMYQGGSDDFLGPRDPVPFPSEEDGVDFEGEFGVILADTPMGVSPEAGQGAIRLLVQLNDWSLRGLAKREMGSGFGFLQAKPATAFAPVAVTPDELGSSWRDGRIALPLKVIWNDTTFGQPLGGAMDYSFGQLIAHAARTRRLRAGTIVGSGTVSNRDAEAVGSACISERRALDAIAGRPQTAFARFGDQVRMEALAHDGQPLFGAIDQTIVRAELAQPNSSNP
jgi:fumarylacetoacetate (FAA) hydrolase